MTKTARRYPDRPIHDYSKHYVPYDGTPETSGPHFVLNTPPKPVDPYEGFQTDPHSKAIGACLTNRRLRQMVIRFSIRSQSDTVPGFHIRLRELHARSPEYFRRLREYYGLDAAEGWLDRELATDYKRLAENFAVDQDAKKAEPPKSFIDFM